MDTCVYHIQQLVKGHEDFITMISYTSQRPVTPAEAQQAFFELDKMISEHVAKNEIIYMSNDDTVAYINPADGPIRIVRDDAPELQPIFDRVNFRGLQVNLHA